MAEETNQRERVAVNVPRERPRAEAANWFHLARAGDDFQLLIGYADLNDIHRLVVSKGTPGPREIDVEVTHRIALSRTSLQHLHSVINEITESEKKL